MRRSVVAARDLPAGTILDSLTLALKRPGTGVDARFLAEFEGRRLLRSLKRDEVVDRSDVSTEATR